MKDLFSYSSYKDYISGYLKGARRGTKSKLCVYMEIHSAYLSQVLDGYKDFTIEQLERFGRFVEFSSVEMEFWLNLCCENKAGSKELEAIYKRKRLLLQNQKINLSKRLGDKKKLNFKAQALYFSSWTYPAIYMLLSLPNIKTVSEISAVLRISEGAVRKALEELEAEGMLIKTDKGYEKVFDWIRLEKESSFITQHHNNIRVRALQNIMENVNSDLHYSSYITLSKKDFEEIKDVFVKSIQKVQTIVEPSKEETLVGLCLDLFEF